MKPAVVGGLMLLGSAFVLLAAVGILRLPDVFTRMHAATKPATLGVGLIIVAVAVHFGEVGIATRALLVGAFFVLTVPVGAHMIGRAAYLTGTPLWEGTVVDEWRDRTRPRADVTDPGMTPRAGNDVSG
ncbi:MAG: monovalent cation/H(+) antiporter subunit G [Candidatus Rokubacteria bacterium]|nr:monovalent cation/H(+) antiporter subunit G [Candidatus Rokubacteria bacterium]